MPSPVPAVVFAARTCRRRPGPVPYQRHPLGHTLSIAVELAIVVVFALVFFVLAFRDCRGRVGTTTAEGRGAHMARGPDPRRSTMEVDQSVCIVTGLLGHRSSTARQLSELGARVVLAAAGPIARGLGPCLPTRCVTTT